ncbi:MAG: TIGR03936 family radical SAM-associated protein [Chloroflexota bacterium]
MNANYAQRLRLTFRKEGATRYIGHLDLARTLERSLNRAQIPMAYTQGFNKRPRMQLAAALPLGYLSECEMADIYLTERMEPEAAREQMMRRMAPGIEIWRVEEVDLQAPALQTLTAVTTFTALLLDPAEPAALQQRIDDLLAAETLIRQRRDKTYDLRPLIENVSLTAADDGSTQIVMRLMMMPAKTGRPDEVLTALDLDPMAARITRTEITLADEA